VWGRSGTRETDRREGNEIRVLAGSRATDRGGGERVVIFWCFIRARLPWSRRKEENEIKVIGGISGEPDGVRAGEALRLQSMEEGAEMDPVECSKPNIRYYARVDAMVSSSAQFYSFFYYFYPPI
jgi:hypothetical protein